MKNASLGLIVSPETRKEVVSVTFVYRDFPR